MPDSFLLPVDVRLFFWKVNGMLNVGSTEASFKEYTSNQKGQHRLAHSLCLNDRFGSLAAYHHRISSTAALEGKAVSRNVIGQRLYGRI